MSTPAPIVIFAYKRLAALRRLVAQLSISPLWRQSPLYIFVDGPKTPSEAHWVAAVTKYSQQIPHSQKQIFCSPNNQGLAASIIVGVSRVMAQHGCAIVLEDDLECSPQLLEYLNQALTKYVQHKTIFSISGYTPPLRFPGDYPYDVYVAPRAASWGWASWYDRWQQVDWQVGDFSHFWQDRLARKQFALGGEDLPYMLYKQQIGAIDSWAIRFSYAMFRQHAYCLFPRYNQCSHLPDANSTHFRFYSRRHYNPICTHNIHIPPTPPGPNAELITAFRRYYALSPWRKWLNQYRYG